MSLEIEGVWAVGVFDTTVWADGVWREGSYVPLEPLGNKMVVDYNEKTMIIEYFNREMII